MTTTDDSESTTPQTAIADGQGTDVPELVPARMVNEFAYCERLFFLEWVQARFADNLDTEEGAFVHRIVDEPTGAVPDPDHIDELKIARSVRLSSERLGLVAVIDLLESDSDSSVVPVDYKKGSPADNAFQAHLPGRLQIAAQILLLRENGYKCNYGVLYFATTRTRVRVDLDAELLEQTHHTLAELRRVASRDDPPPPLIDSPKCRRCSLVGLCLPDETNALTGRSTRKPRRLMPSGSDAMPLHVTEPGTYLGKDQGLITVSIKGTRANEIRLIDVSHLCVYGNVQISTQLIRELLDRDVPIAHFTGGGWFKGITHGMPSKHVELRIRQAALVAQGGLSMSKACVAGKISNCRVLLRRNAKRDETGAIERLAKAVNEVDRADSTATLRGIEGAAARTYFTSFESMISDQVSDTERPFSFEGRNRRPPTDPINCMLSFGYALLTKDLTITTMLVGFDPYMGFYHRPRFGRPALALDLAEEFRPLIVDSVVVSVINNGELRPNHFEARGPGINMTKDGRRAFLRAYERRMATEVTHPLFGYKITYRRVLEVQARLLGAVILGEIPNYQAFRTR